MSERREHLEREGWVLVPGLLGPKVVRELVEGATILAKAGGSYTRDTVVRGVGFEVQSASGRKGEEAVAPGVLRKVTFPSKGQRAFTHLPKNPELLAALEDAGLQTPVCLVDHLNLKAPRVGTGYPFHQDTQFLVGATQGRIERHGGLNLVLALDPADADNGAFEVLGRTHHGPPVDFPYDMKSLNEGVFDETHRVLCAMEPGDAVFFHPRLAHGSGPNRSDRLRRMVAMWFVGGGGASTRALREVAQR